MRAHNFRQVMLPYCIVPLTDGFHIVLNRRYKPLGVISDEHVDYEEHFSKVRFKDLTRAKAKAIGLEVDDKPGGYLYLYSDSTNPDRSSALAARYGKILAGLMALEILEGPPPEGAFIGSR